MIAIGVEVETQEKSSEKTHAGHAGIGEKAHKADQNEGTNIDDDPGLIGGGMAPMRPYSQSRWRRGWLGSSISPVTPPQRTYRMACFLNG